jgi:hypothetical protein
LEAEGDGLADASPEAPLHGPQMRMPAMSATATTAAVMRAARPRLCDGGGGGGDAQPGAGA